MCDVHLVETKREITTWKGLCSYCECQIDGGCAVVYGTLDDGSPGVHVLHYHPDCLNGIEFEGQDENEGCFSYGRVSQVIES